MSLTLRLAVPEDLPMLRDLMNAAIGELLNITPETVRQRLGLEPMPAREADGQTHP